MRSKKMNIGLAICVLLAKSNSTLTTVQISKQLDISVSYCEQVISSLNNSGLIKSRRGAKGGYQASINLMDTSIKLVMELFDPISNASETAFNFIAAVNNMENHIYINMKIRDLVKEYDALNKEVV
ncbi:Rrf2 family transcriptional regulator [Vibrio sp. TBV020]|uniref:Rrf2 family transcriptional regulator n=1 Tax=Vibrio sp. TBV020 TaxID=3137398 RepID=UPI0038CD209C